jgi:digalactosyldiacylglycerol synthase
MSICEPVAGTSVNPLLRAAYLSHDVSRKVTLVVPFLPHCDQSNLHPNGQIFQTPEDQETYIKNWVTNRVGFSPGPNFNIKFYPAR